MGDRAEGGDLLVQGMPDLVNGFVFWFCKVSRLDIEGVVLEEKADLVAGGHEVLVGDVFFGGRGAGGVRAGHEAGHRVGVEGEVVEEGLCLSEERGAGIFGEVGGDEEVAVAVELGELFGGEAGWRGCGGWGDAGGRHCNCAGRSPLRCRGESRDVGRQSGILSTSGVWIKWKMII